MIAIKNTIISDDVLDKKFVCDLNACKGECCVSGESGAPLDEDELPMLMDVLDKVKPYLNAKGLKAIKKHGPYVLDSDGDYTTTLIGPEAACAFVIYDENKIAKCAIEQAYYDGVVSWKKPISCHLYPIRITRNKTFDAVNYHSWDVCKPACECGAKLEVPVYKFLQGPLIRKYGEDWFKELELVADERRKAKAKK
jgi:hypothetical protein